MDRREAMLRELHLYPLWVRRHVHETLPSIEAAEAPLGERLTSACPESVERYESVHISTSSMRTDVKHDVAELIAPSVDVTAASLEVPPVADCAAVCVDARLEAEDLFVAAPQVHSGEDTLREFQLKVAGGPLADIGWTELAQKVRDCEVCALRSGCTQTVFGSGDEQADWLFVGEAPGAEEDASAAPFVGHAGQLLDNMLMSIGLERSKNVYIANVIKCRPEGDRHPHVGEIAACLPYLKRQIALLNPRVIVALGKTAASALLDSDATIASQRGAIHDYNGIPLIVTYHPAYLLRSPMEKAKAWQDLRLAVATLRR